MMMIQNKKKEIGEKHCENEKKEKVEK